MHPSRSKGATGADALQRVIVFVCAFILWGVLTGFLRETGIYEAVEKASESLRPGNTELLIALFCLPAIYAIFRFAVTEYRVGPRVPRIFRLSVLVLNLLTRSMCLATGYYLYLFALPFVAEFLPPEAVAFAFFGFLGVGIVSSVIRGIRQRASKKTVVELYESLLCDDLSTRAKLCDPEVVERFVALESQTGKLTSYQIVNQVTDEMQTSYMVQSVRDGLPRFEEVLIRPDGKRVVQVTALCI